MNDISGLEVGDGLHLIGEEVITVDSRSGNPWQGGRLTELGNCPPVKEGS